MNELVNSLEKIGLSDKEARVYLSLLKYREATVSDIANEADIKRPTAYVILDELRKKGLVLKIPHAKKSIYMAKSPEELTEYVSDNVKEFERALPKIQSLSTERKAVKTLYFEGVEGVKESLKYKFGDLDGEKITGFWAKVGGVEQKIFDVMVNHFNSYEKKNISVEGITPDDESTRFFKDKYKNITQDLKLVPKEDYSSDISIEIISDFIRIIDAIELKAVIIENQRVADTMRQIFDLVKRNYEKK